MSKKYPETASLPRGHGKSGFCSYRDAFTRHIVSFSDGYASTVVFHRQLLQDKAPTLGPISEIPTPLGGQKGQKGFPQENHTLSLNSERIPRSVGNSAMQQGQTLVSRCGALLITNHDISWKKRADSKMCQALEQGFSSDSMVLSQIFKFLSVDNVRLGFAINPYCPPAFGNSHENTLLLADHIGC
jgi:hypothetical protein